MAIATSKHVLLVASSDFGKIFNDIFSGDVKKRSVIQFDTMAIDDKDSKGKLDPEKLENMDKKLQSIEDFIIGETIKYTGAHEGNI